MKTKPTGFSIPFIPEHVRLAESKLGFLLPNTYVDIIKSCGQCEYMDTNDSQSLLFIRSVYGLFTAYDQMTKTIEQMGDPAPLSIGLFPFASDRDGALFWDITHKTSTDYKVVSNPLLLKSGYESDATWESTSALIDHWLSRVKGEIVIKMFQDGTSKSAIDEMIADFLLRVC